MQLAQNLVSLCGHLSKGLISAWSCHPAPHPTEQPSPHSSATSQAGAGCLQRVLTRYLQCGHWIFQGLPG